MPRPAYLLEVDELMGKKTTLPRLHSCHSNQNSDATWIIKQVDWLPLPIDAIYEREKVKKWILEFLRWCLLKTLIDGRRTDGRWTDN